MKLHKSGIEPRYLEMRRRLSNPSILREKAIRDAWANTLRELGVVNKKSLT